LAEGVVRRLDAVLEALVADPARAGDAVVAGDGRAGDAPRGVGARTGVADLVAVAEDAVGARGVLLDVGTRIAPRVAEVGGARLGVVAVRRTGGDAPHHRAAGHGPEAEGRGAAGAVV